MARTIKLSRSTDNPYPLEAALSPIETEYVMTQDIDVYNSTTAVDVGFWVGPAPTLLGPPVPSFIETPVVGGSGSRIVFNGHNSRDIILPIFIMAEDPEDLERGVNEFMTFLDSDANGNMPITLSYETGLGEVRTIETYPVAGYTAIQLENTDSFSVRFKVQLKAPDPYWYSEGYHDIKLLDSVGNTHAWVAGNLVTGVSEIDDEAFTHHVYVDLGTLIDDAAVNVWLRGTTSETIAVHHAYTDKWFMFTDDLISGYTWSIVETDPRVRGITSYTLDALGIIETAQSPGLSPRSIPPNFYGIHNDIAVPTGGNHNRISLHSNNEYVHLYFRSRFLTC